jgi:hypothetical protein
MPCPTTDMCLGIVSGVYRRTDSDDEATLQVFISIEGYNIPTMHNIFTLYW